MTTSTATPPPLAPQAPIPSSVPSSSDRTLAALCHVSVWLDSFTIGLGIILPLILLLTKRDESPFIAAHARESLNFQISLLIYLVCSIPLIFILVGIPMMIGIFLLGFICPIIATIRAADGGYGTYPFTIRFI